MHFLYIYSNNFLNTLLSAEAGSFAGHKRLLALLLGSRVETVAALIVGEQPRRLAAASQAGRRPRLSFPPGCSCCSRGVSQCPPRLQDNTINILIVEGNM